MTRQHWDCLSPAGFPGCNQRQAASTACRESSGAPRHLVPTQERAIQILLGPAANDSPSREGQDGQGARRKAGGRGAGWALDSVGFPSTTSSICRLRASQKGETRRHVAITNLGKTPVMVMVVHMCHFLEDLSADDIGAADRGCYC